MELSEQEIYSGLLPVRETAGFPAKNHFRTRLPAAAPGHLRDKRPHHHPDPKEESLQWPPSLQLCSIVPKAFTVSLNPAFHPLRMVAFLSTFYMTFPL